MMNAPKTDDFRLDKQDDDIVVTFTPTGRTYTFSRDSNGQLSKPTVSQAQTSASDYSEDDVHNTAAELVKLAVFGSSQG
jgi:YD repeat-containing protein